MADYPNNPNNGNGWGGPTRAQLKQERDQLKQERDQFERERNQAQQERVQLQQQRDHDLDEAQRRLDEAQQQLGDARSSNASLAEAARRVEADNATMRAQLDKLAPPPIDLRYLPGQDRQSLQTDLAGFVGASRKMDDWRKNLEAYKEAYNRYGLSIPGDGNG